MQSFNMYSMGNSDLN